MKQIIKTNIIPLGIILILFISGAFAIFNTTNSYGGGDNLAHYFASHYGWDYPKLLFGHWSKPVFTILSSPFAQFGYNGLRIYNLLMGLSTAFIAYKIAEVFNLKTAITALFFTVLAPVYFILMFTGLTEVTFSFFLMLAIYLFFINKLHWSAIVLSFAPIIRTEGIILIPLFIIAYGLKKSYLSIPLLASGFLLISALGYTFHSSFWWLITEMPYTGSADFYGSGDWNHFLIRIDLIIGYTITFLFVVSTILLVINYLKKGVFVFKRDFYILLLIVAPFILYFVAHSIVWWLFTGRSLGLIRVIGAVTPLASLIAVFSIEKIYLLIPKRFRIIAFAFSIIGIYFMANSAFKPYKWGFYPSNNEKLMKQAANYLKSNNLDTNKVVFYDFNLIYNLGINPYDSDKCSWMIQNKQQPSLKDYKNTIYVWDAHFGNNEGQMPIDNLLNDKALTLINKFEPEIPHKTLGGYEYEIYIFQKISTDTLEKILFFEFDFNTNSKIDNEYSICFEVKSLAEYCPGLVVNTSNICNKYTEFDIKVSVDIKPFKDNYINELNIVVSIEGGETYVYNSHALDSLISDENNWQSLEYTFNSIGVSAGNSILKVYIWNKGKNHFLMDNFKVELKAANVVIKH